MGVTGQARTSNSNGNSLVVSAAPALRPSAEWKGDLGKARRRAEAPLYLEGRADATTDADSLRE